ncbi:MAG: histidine phosphatase family protein [Rubrivivax sp.]|nr:histidine phosphatase family protein [Rubrivivax sp.]
MKPQNDGSSATELLFIRHGETDWNRQQRFQGHIDVPLNDTGHAQAQRLAARLAAEQHDALFSSDLQRARQTAAPLAAAWGRDDGVLPGFREQNFGLLEGLDAPTIQALHPELWRGWLQQDADFAAPGGESQRQFHTRILGAVHALVAAQAGRRVVVVTHGGVLDMLWRTAKGLPLSGLRECHIPNTGVNRIRWADGRLQIEVWGDDTHLVAAG